MKKNIIALALGGMLAFGATPYSLLLTMALCRLLLTTRSW